MLIHWTDNFMLNYHQPLSNGNIYNCIDLLPLMCRVKKKQKRCLKLPTEFTSMLILRNNVKVQLSY